MEERDTVEIVDYAKTDDAIRALGRPVIPNSVLFGPRV